MKKIFAVTAIIASLAASPMAQASNSASMVLDWSEFSITFLNGTGSFTTPEHYAFAQTYNDYGSSGYVEQEGSAAANLLVDGASAYSQANSATVSANTSVGYAANASYRVATSYAQVFGSATLNPGAKIEISVPFSATVAVDDQYHKGETANAEGGIFVSLNDNYTSREWQDSSSIFASAWSRTASTSGVFELVISNRTNGTQTLSWLAQSYASAQTSLAAPVPEPETYAMLMAGLGIIGAVTRLRKQKA